MFLRLFRLRVGIENSEAFVQFYHQSIFPKLKKFPGCRFAGLIKSTKSPCEFISLTFWEDQQQAEEYSRSEIYLGLVQRLQPMLAYSSEWKIELSEDFELQYTPVPEKPELRHYTVYSRSESDRNQFPEPGGLFVRIVSAKIKEGKFPELQSIYEQEIIPVLQNTPGCLDAFLTRNFQETEEAISLTIWEDRRFAEEYEQSGVFQNLVSKAKHTFSDVNQWGMNLKEGHNLPSGKKEEIAVSQYYMIKGEKFRF